MWGNISKGERPPRSASTSQTSSPTFVAAISLVKVMNLPIWKNTKQFTQSSFDWLDLDSAMFSRYGPFNSHSSTTVATYHTNFDIFFWYMFHYVSLKNCPYLQPRLMITVFHLVCDPWPAGPKHWLRWVSDFGRDFSRWARGSGGELGWWEF